MAITDGAHITESGLRLRKVVNADAVNASFDSVTEAIALDHPQPSMWLALENWATVAVEDAGVLMNVFQTSDGEADILATYGSLLVASPQGALTDIRFANGVERVTRHDVARIPHVATGIRWAIAASAEAAADATRLKRIAVIGTQALGGLSFKAKIPN